MSSESLQRCLELGRQRLHPSCTNPNYLVLRRRREIFQKWLETLPGNHLRVLDIGGRYQPYRPLLEAKLKSYFALDIRPTPMVNIVGTGESLPFCDQAFDMVIATQVFEYFEKPDAAAAEIHRVLKPGGCLLLSVAAVAPRFAGEECWRYLPGGLRVLLSKFSQVEIIPELHSAASFFRSLNLYLSMAARYSWVRAAVHHSAVPVFNVAGRFVEGRWGRGNDQFAANYSVRATK